MSNTQEEALIIGEALVDIVISHNKPAKEVCGGSPANVALGLGRLGKNVNLTAWIGKDSHGKFIEDYLQESKVKLTEGCSEASWTSTAKATLDEHSNASYEFKIQWDPIKPKIDNLLVIHTGSIGATLLPGAKTVLELLQDYSKYSTLTYDPNIRPSIMGERENVYDHIMDIISKVDVVKASDEDVKWLEPEKNYQEFAKSLLEKGVKIVAITRAEKGVWVCTKSGIEKNYPTLATKLVDTVGAGDSFMAGIINGLWDHSLLGASNRQKLASIDEKTLDTIIVHASKIAAITVSRHGADLPYLHEVINLDVQ
ncbi:carbohydrate kinase [Actinomyces sp. zg-332]|uniref:carbohydrate kinase family protein n=1 Tax=Actinomyces sp. zg-332 TaxID=2708340 RepID=UPI00141EC90E|nr:carbohydrate kinase [Actinomyces sp. zg-332]QPK94309.1 carbohydrate kinase [Actinomyces sp. zg-332]